MRAGDAPAIADARSADPAVERAIALRHQAALAVAGDDPDAALDALAGAARALPVRHPMRSAVAVERAFALLAAGETRLALRAARAAAAAADRAGDSAERARALLAAAVAALRDGDDGAAEDAVVARDALRWVGDTRAALVAEIVALRAEQRAGRRPSGVAAAAGSAARRLSAMGAAELADQARVIAARGHLDAGRPERAAAALEAVSSRRASSAAAAAYGRALVALSSGDRRRAATSLAAGLRAVDRARAAAPAGRRTALGHLDAELSDLGVAMAIADRRPAAVLRWAERARANAVAVSVPATPASQGAVHRLVRNRTIVEFVESAERLSAVVVSAGRTTLHDLGDAETVRREVHGVRFALRRLVVPGRPAASTAAAAAALAAGASALDTRLLAALGARLGPGPVVVVPTGVLFALPWRALPTLADRSFVVAPSLRLWAAAATRRAPRSRAGTLLVAGPHLPGARAELAEIRRVVPGASVLQGRSATPARVLGALNTARVAHIAAHGRFKAGDPMSSALVLSGALLTVRDIGAAGVGSPDTVVLSACDAGLSGVHAGDELLGLGAVFLAAGARSLIAPVVPVPDAATAAFMVSLHRRMVGGASPSAALARISGGVRSGDGVLERAVACAFVPFGAR